MYTKQHTRNKLLNVYILFVALPFTLLIALLNTGLTAQAAPFRAHCGVVTQHSTPCLSKQLLDWQGNEQSQSPTVTVPQRWTVFVRCLPGKGSVTVYGYDAQMTLFSESFTCSGLWYHENFTLADSVFFGVNRPAEIQVWS